jgi:chromosome partitioning protein
MEALRKHATAYLRERRFLANALRLVENDYDYILIDCPPNLYLMTQCALVASDYYVITAIPDHLSTIGLYMLRNKVEEIGKRIRAAQTFENEKTHGRAVADFGGIVFVKVRVVGAAIANMHASRMRQIEDGLEAGSCFRTYTTELIGYGEASEGFLPVWMHSSPNAKVASRNREYEKITDELLSRM